MKTITIAGNITRDAEVRTTQGGDKVTGFSVAVNDRNKNATFFDCSMWGKRGEGLSQYLTKGSKVAVSGDFGTREHNGKTYLTVNVSEVTLMGGKQAGEPATGAYGNRQNPPASSADLDQDSIPF